MLLKKRKKLLSALTVLVMALSILSISSVTLAAAPTRATIQTVQFTVFDDNNHRINATTYYSGGQYYVNLRGMVSNTTFNINVPLSSVGIDKQGSVIAITVTGLSIPNTSYVNETMSLTFNLTSDEIYKSITVDKGYYWPNYDLHLNRESGRSAVVDVSFLGVQFTVDRDQETEDDGYLMIANISLITK